MEVIGLTDVSTELIEKSLAGDTEAFAFIVKHYQTAIYNLAFRILGNRDDALDAAQEAFIKLYSSLPTYRGEARFTSWFYRIATNVCLDRYRHNKKYRMNTVEEYTEQTLPRGPDAAVQDPEQIYQTKERQASVQAAIRELPVKYRTAIVLKHMEGLSYQEISEIMNIPVKTVGTHIHRAKAILQKKLNPTRKGGMPNE